VAEIEIGMVESGNIIGRGAKEIGRGEGMIKVGMARRKGDMVMRRGDMVRRSIVMLRSIDTCLAVVAEVDMEKRRERSGGRGKTEYGYKEDVIH